VPAPSYFDVPSNLGPSYLPNFGGTIATYGVPPSIEDVYNLRMVPGHADPDAAGVSAWLNAGGNASPNPSILGVPGMLPFDRSARGLGASTPTADQFYTGLIPAPASAAFSPMGFSLSAVPGLPSESAFGPLPSYAPLGSLTSPFPSLSAQKTAPPPAPAPSSLATAAKIGGVGLLGLGLIVGGAKLLRRPAPAPVAA
jgi:hypothetical protein